MEIWNALKVIYRGKENLLNNIILFSLSGITAILGSKCWGYYFNSFYFGYPPSAAWFVLFCCSYISCVIFYFYGYLFYFSNALYKEQDKLPDYSLKAMECFGDMLPVTLYWGIIYGLMLFLGLMLFNLQKEFIQAVAYYSVLLFILPFINIILVMFSKDFKNRFKFYSLKSLFVVLYKTFVPVVLYTIQSIVISGVSIFVMFKLFVLTNKISIPVLQFGIRILLLTTSIYWVNIINYINIFGFVKASKNVEI